MDNPFREEGQLSKFASDIVDAVKSGRLDQIKPEESEEQINNNLHTDIPQQKHPEEPQQRPEGKGDEKIDRKLSEGVGDTVEVEVGLVISPKLSQTQTIILPESRTKVSRKCSCCVLL